jgi:hypothetical protein
LQISSEDGNNDCGSSLIRMTSLQVLGRDFRLLLKKTGCVALPLFGQAYQEMFFIELKPALYGYPDIPSLLRGLPHIVRLTGRPGRKFVELSPVLGLGSGKFIIEENVYHRKYHTLVTQTLGTNRGPCKSEEIISGFLAIPR